MKFSAFGIAMNENVQGGQLGSGKLDGQGIPANFFSDADVRRGFVAAFDDIVTARRELFAEV